jgi:formylglycine-generating enzyme
MRMLAGLAAALTLPILAGGLARAQDRPIVAVFDLEVKGARIDKGMVDRLTDYLGSLMARKGFKVVPRSQLKARLTEAKKGSYQACYDEGCQIEIGKELAASKSLASQVLKLGKQCKVTVNLFDLRTAASDGAGAGSGDCDEDGVVKSLEGAVDDLMRTTLEPAAEPPGASVPVTAAMVRIPAGEFLMGCSPGDGECEPDEQPPHPVSLGEFWLDVTEVTMAEYKRCVDAGRCQSHFSDETCFILHEDRGRLPDSFRGEQQPAVCVDWSQAKGYCGWAGKRLPTEAEWERAARGGTALARYGDLGEIAWYDLNSGGSTREVGKKTPNAFGLYDMLGNAWEWCSDWYREDYYKDSPGRDPRGSDLGSKRVLRGGSWSPGSPKYPGTWIWRASHRYSFQPDYGFANAGFRCASSTAPRR